LILKLTVAVWLASKPVKPASLERIVFDTTVQEKAGKKLYFIVGLLGLLLATAYRPNCWKAGAASPAPVVTPS